MIKTIVFIFIILTLAIVVSIYFFDFSEKDVEFVKAFIDWFWEMGSNLQQSLRSKKMKMLMMNYRSKLGIPFLFFSRYFLSFKLTSDFAIPSTLHLTSIFYFLYCQYSLAIFTYFSSSFPHSYSFSPLACYRFARPLLWPFALPLQA